MPKNREWTVRDLLTALGKRPWNLPVTIVWAATDDTGPHYVFQVVEYKDAVEIVIGYDDNDSAIEVK